MSNVKVTVELPDETTRTVISARGEDETVEEIGERVAALQGGKLISAEETDQTFTAYTVVATPDDVG